jgi:hypothetical protein
MRQRNSKILSPNEYLKLWRDLENREFTPDEASNMATRDDIESRISSALSSFGRDGWDFRIDHFGPPSGVVRISLMNCELHRREVVEAVVCAFDPFAPPWVLDLGFVDAIENNVWARWDDVGRLIVTATKFFLDERLAVKALPCLQTSESP